MEGETPPSDLMVTTQEVVPLPYASIFKPSCQLHNLQVYQHAPCPGMEKICVLRVLPALRTSSGLFSFITYDHWPILLSFPVDYLCILYSKPRAVCNPRLHITSIAPCTHLALWQAVSMPVFSEPFFHEVLQDLERQPDEPLL